MGDDDHGRFLGLEARLVGQMVGHVCLVMVQLDLLVVPNYGSHVARRVAMFGRAEVVDCEVAQSVKERCGSDDRDGFLSYQLLLVMQQADQHKKRFDYDDLDRLGQKEADESVVEDVVEVLVHSFELAGSMVWVVAQKAARYLVYVQVGLVVYVRHLVPDDHATYLLEDDHDLVADL